MRRPAAAVLGTIAGTALLLGAKVGTRPPAHADTVAAGPPGEQVPGASADPSGSGAATTPPGPGSSRPPGPTATAGAASRAPTQTTSTQPGAPAPTGGSGLHNGTFTGVKVTHQYGTMQVTITVSGGKITDAKAAYTTTSPTSAKITGDAVPKLRQEALTAQSANIATVSGATYTSNAYRTSLQAALDRARA